MNRQSLGPTTQLCTGERSCDMPFKDPEKRREKQREYAVRHYKKNAAKIKVIVAKNKRVRRQRWNEFKATQACSHCGAMHPAIIDFHHIVRDETYRSVNALTQQSNFTAALEEIKKCIPLCANCHRVLHWNEEQEKKKERKRKRKKSARREHKVDANNDTEGNPPRPRSVKDSE